MNAKLVSLGTAVAIAVAIAALGPFSERRARVTPLDDVSAVSEPARAPAPAARPDEAAASASRLPGGSGPGDDASPSDIPSIRGLVVDAATGEPIADGSIVVTLGDSAHASQGRLARRAPSEDAPVVAGIGARSVTTPTGRFSVPWPSFTPADLRVSAPGHLDETRAGVSPDGEVRIKLRPGIPIRGRVRRPDGVPIEGAIVRAESAPVVDPGRSGSVASSGRSDTAGAFEVLGLHQVVATISATHPDYMPGSVRATPDSATVDITLAHALRVWFRLRTSDRTPIAPPTVQWARTSAAGAPLSIGVVDLATDRAPASTIDALEPIGPVRVPASPGDGTVRFTIRAPGRLAWTSDEIAVPAAGGERTFDAILEPDPGVGSIVVRMKEPDGGSVAFVATEAVVTVHRRDGPAATPRPVERDGALVFDNLAAGTYEVFATERRFGAASVVVEVEGGRESPGDVTLATPAALRVRFDAGSERRVHFQLLRDGAVVPAFADPQGKGAPDAATDRTYFFAGRDGTTIRGLSAGRYVIRIVSPDLIASETATEVSPGTVTEVEISARSR